MPRGITLLIEEGQRVERSKELKSLALQVARNEKLQGQVNLVFCSNEKVRALNREFRGLDKVTDVLSFGWEEPDFAGEIFIANPQAKHQAPRWNNSYFNELRRLVIHGMLHLCGFDHIRTTDRLNMRKKEGFYLKTPKTAKKQ